MIQPRPYQIEALEAVDHHLRHNDTNPCVVIPTGGGKSILMAWAIQQWKAGYPPLRVVVIAHRKELIQQNAAEMHGVWPMGDIGAYAAGLNRRDREHSIIFASIDSVYNKWGEFAPFDLIIVDEAHRIPLKGEGKYRQFIKGARKLNKDLRVIGFTATPFRMSGPICHRDHILHEICYEASISALIADGYLCKLRSRIGKAQPDLAKVRRQSGGDYVVTSLSEAVSGDNVVPKAVQSAVEIIRREERRSTIWFCVDVAHCQKVSDELRKYGVHAPMVTAKTRKHDRERHVREFIAGDVRHLLNVNVYTEGFNAKQVDCIVLLRPTLSMGLYAQMVGRGLRVHPQKTDCLVLDYAHCIDEHGPIDCLDAGQVRLVECEGCGDTFSIALAVCPHCGHPVPKKEIERAAAEEREKKLHEAEASQREILGNTPVTYPVDSVTIHRHTKDGKPDSMRVEYRCGLALFREWICPDHGGVAERKARCWIWKRFGRDFAAAATTESVLGDMFFAQELQRLTKSITTVRRGKYSEIIKYDLASEHKVEGWRL